MLAGIEVIGPREPGWYDCGYPAGLPFGGYPTLGGGREPGGSPLAGR
jgi:hypothetical protein